MSLQLTSVKALQAFQVMRQGSIILTGILLSKSQIGLAAIGQYELLLFLGTTFSFFWLSSMLQGVLPLYPKLNAEEKKSSLLNSYLLFLFAGLIMLLIFWVGGEFLVQVLTGQPRIPFLFLYLLFFTINLPTFLVEYIYLLDNRPKHILTFGALSFFLQVLLFISPIYLGYTLRESFYLLIGLAVIKHLWTLRLVFRKGTPAFNTKLFGPYWKIVVPIMGMSLLASFTTFFDNWLVGTIFKSEDDFAIFRFGARELPLVTALSFAFGNALIPEVAKSEDFAIARIKEKSALLMHFLFPLSILLLWTSPYWFTWVFSEAFADSVIIFNTFLLVIISRLLFPNTILIGKQNTKVPFWCTFAGLVVNVSLSAWWVFEFGMVGIAYATVIAFIFEKLLMVFFLQRAKIHFSRYIPVGWWLFYSGILVGSYIWNM